MDAISKRARDWREFSHAVFNHIEKYTVPQYGDAPEDQVEQWSVNDCALAIRKYVARIRTNVRDGQDELDCLKIAHYAQLMRDKLSREK